MSFVMRVVWALVVASVVSVAVYWMMTRGASPRRHPRTDRVVRKVKKAADEAQHAIEQVKKAAGEIKNVEAAVRKAEKVITSVPDMYRHAADEPGGEHRKSGKSAKSESSMNVSK